MHANEAFDPITAPLRGAPRGLVVRTVSGQVTAFHVKDDRPAACAAVLALIHRSWRAERPCGPKGPPDVRGPLQPTTALRIQWAA